MRPVKISVDLPWWPINACKTIVSLQFMLLQLLWPTHWKTMWMWSAVPSETEKPGQFHGCCLCILLKDCVWKMDSDSKDLTTPSNLTTGWLGREAARLPRDSHSLEPGCKVPEVSCEDGDGISSPQTLYSAFAFLEVLHPLLVVQVFPTQTLWLTGAEWL